MSVQEWQGNIDKGKGKEKQTRRDTEVDWIKVSSAFFFLSLSPSLPSRADVIFSPHLLIECFIPHGTTTTPSFVVASVQSSTPRLRLLVDATVKPSTATIISTPVLLLLLFYIHVQISLSIHLSIVITLPSSFNHPSLRSESRLILFPFQPSRIQTIWLISFSLQLSSSPTRSSSSTEEDSTAHPTITPQSLPGEDRPSPCRNGLTRRHLHQHSRRLRSFVLFVHGESHQGRSGRTFTCIIAEAKGV